MMHIRHCECDECLPGFPSAPTKLRATGPDEPTELPTRTKQTVAGKIRSRWAAQSYEVDPDQFPDPEARKRAENARAYAKRKLLDDSLDA
jgi:hypothetical protein